MLIAVEAEIDTNGVVTLLEPVTVTRKTRAVVTLLEEKAEKPQADEPEQPENALAQWREARKKDPNAKFPAKIIADDLPVRSRSLGINGWQQTATNTTVNTSRSTAISSLPSATVIKKPRPRRVNSA